MWFRTLEVDSFPGAVTTGTLLETPKTSITRSQGLYTITKTATSQPSSSSHSTEQPNVLGLAIGIPLGVIALANAAFLMWKLRRSRRTEERGGGIQDGWIPKAEVGVFERQVHEIQ
jgi:hypothetical protein